MMIGMLDDVSRPEISQENEDHVWSLCFIVSVITFQVGCL